jgi:hypothetical protein
MLTVPELYILSLITTIKLDSYSSKEHFIKYVE